MSMPELRVFDGVETAGRDAAVRVRFRSTHKLLARAARAAQIHHTRGSFLRSFS